MRNFFFSYHYCITFMAHKMPSSGSARRTSTYRKQCLSGYCIFVGGIAVVYGRSGETETEFATNSSSAARLSYLASPAQTGVAIIVECHENNGWQANLLSSLSFVVRAETQTAETFAFVSAQNLIQN